MLDLGCFSEDNFNVVQWINSYFKSSRNTDVKDTTVSSLVSRLQIYVEQINFALEKSSLQLISIMPLVITDTHAFQAEISVLTKKMFQLQSEIGHIHQCKGSCLSDLERMEAIALKLYAAKHGMQESDGWGKLTSELDELLERNDICGSKDKFMILKYSILAQTGLPGRIERESQFEYFTNRLEALVIPAIIQCFQQADVEKCLKYVEIFNIISRLPQLKQCYRTVHKNLLLDRWTKVIEAGESWEVMQEFYDILFVFLQNQQKLCKQVCLSILEPLDTVSETLIYLHSSRQAYVTKLLKKSSKKFEVLANVAESNINFALAMEGSFKNQEIPAERIVSLSEAIFQYFDIFVEQYPSLEVAYSNELMTDLVNSDASVAENVRNLDNSNKKVTKWVDDALQRCLTVSQHKALPNLLKVLQSFTRAYIEKFAKVQLQLIINRSEQTDWRLLQLNVNALQYLGDLMQIIKQCEKKICCISNKEIVVFDESNSRLLQIYANRNGSNKQLGNANNVPIVTGLFAKEYELLRKVAIKIHDTVLKLVLFSIETQFKEMEFAMKAQCEEFDLPDYSYAPQEYITQVGQYLLTLPQHLEPLLLSPTTSLKTIMELCENKYEQEKPCVDVLLTLIVEETSAVYQEKIDDLFSLNITEAKQLAVDIEYFGNVLEEMSLPLSNNLQQIITLLRAPLDQYNAASAGCNPRLVTTIRQKRNIVSR